MVLINDDVKIESLYLHILSVKVLNFMLPKYQTKIHYFFNLFVKIPI